MQQPVFILDSSFLMAMGALEKYQRKNTRTPDVSADESIFKFMDYLNSQGASFILPNEVLKEITFMKTGSSHLKQQGIDRGEYRSQGLACVGKGKVMLDKYLLGKVANSPKGQPFLKYLMRQMEQGKVYCYRSAEEYVLTCRNMRHPGGIAIVPNARLELENHLGVEYHHSMFKNAAERWTHSSPQVKGEQKGDIEIMALRDKLLANPAKRVAYGLLTNDKPLAHDFSTKGGAQDDRISLSIRLFMRLLDETHYPLAKDLQQVMQRNEQSTQFTDHVFGKKLYFGENVRPVDAQRLSTYMKGSNLPPAPIEKVADAPIKKEPSPEREALKEARSQHAAQPPVLEEEWVAKLKAHFARNNGKSGHRKG